MTERLLGELEQTYRRVMQASAELTKHRNDEVVMHELFDQITSPEYNPLFLSAFLSGGDDRVRGKVSRDMLLAVLVRLPVNLRDKAAVCAISYLRGGRRVDG
jgi:hypothetical protein